jgi:hypothetical protein
VVANILERMHDMLAIIAQREAPVRQAKHAVAVRLLPRQQAGPTGGTRGAAQKALRKSRPCSASR